MNLTGNELLELSMHDEKIFKQFLKVIYEVQFPMILEKSGEVFGRIVEQVYLNAVNNKITKMITIPINIDDKKTTIK